MNKKGVLLATLVMSVMGCSGEDAFVLDDSIAREFCLKGKACQVDESLGMTDGQVCISIIKSEVEKYSKCSDELSKLYLAMKELSCNDFSSFAQLKPNHCGNDDLSQNLNGEYDAYVDCLNRKYSKVMDACKLSGGCWDDSIAIIDGENVICGKSEKCVDGECVPKCGKHEVVDEDDDVCRCDRENHWVNTGTGCGCDEVEGYVQDGDVCRFTCDALRETYNPVSKVCRCSKAEHWVGTAGSCACEEGFVFFENACEPIGNCNPERERLDASSDTCLCNSTGHWTGTAGNCVCEAGYELVGNVCQFPNNCDAIKEVFNPEDGSCACNEAAHWAGTAGSCACETGFVLKGTSCVAPLTCPDNEIYDASNDTCGCDGNKHWVGESGQCTCDEKAGFMLVGDVCQSICSSEKEMFDVSKGACVCNTFDGYVDVQGTCKAASEIAVGDIVTFGVYEQDNNTSNGKEPMEWRVLDIDDGKYLLLSVNAIDEKRISADESDTWLKSSIRAWLNGYDYNSSTFNYSNPNSKYGNFIDRLGMGKSLIVENKEGTGSNASYWVFLLNEAQVNKYLPTEADRKAHITEFAINEGGKPSDSSCTKTSSPDNCLGSWWLIDIASNKAKYVTYEGKIASISLKNTDNVVRPAMWVRF